MKASDKTDLQLARALFPQDRWSVSSARSDNLIILDGLLWDPRHNIGDAWKIVDRLREMRWILWIGPAADNSPRWDVQIKPRTQNLHQRITANTPQMAIYSAALSAMDITEPA